MTKMVRASRRSTKSSAEQVHSLHPVKDSLVSKPKDDETSPDEHSFIYSPSRRRTRGKLCVHSRTCCFIHDGFLTLFCLSVS